jgi:hypothetical protein
MVAYKGHEIVQWNLTLEFGQSNHVNHDDEITAIADSKIAVVFIFFHISVFLVVLVVITFCHCDPCRLCI